MTKRIYETDGECRNFTATVRSCEQVDGGWLVRLDQTAFFPESGGQAADRGKLGNANVLDVQLTPDEDIVHKTDAPLTVGETEDPAYSRITISMRGNDLVKQQLINQLKKLCIVKKKMHVALTFT